MPAYECEAPAFFFVYDPFEQKLEKISLSSAYINMKHLYPSYATSPPLPETCTLALCEQRCQPWLELRCSSLLLWCCALPWRAAPARRGRWLGSTSSRTRRGISPSRSPTGEPPSCLSSFLTPKVWFGFLASKNPFPPNTCSHAHVNFLLQGTWLKFT